MAERKTAAERAQALVDSAKSKVDRLEAQWTKLEPQARRVKADLDEAKEELAFARQHPALAGGAAQVASRPVEAETVVEPDTAANLTDNTPVEANESDVAAETTEAKGRSRAAKKAAAPEPAVVEEAPTAPAPQPTLVDDDPFSLD